MAKEVTAIVKLQCPAGQATPAPPAPRRRACTARRGARYTVIAMPR